MRQDIREFSLLYFKENYIGRKQDLMWKKKFCLETTCLNTDSAACKTCCYVQVNKPL